MTEDCSWGDRFAEEFTTVIQTYQPDFSDFYQLIHTLVGEGQAKHGMKLAWREHPESDLEKQTPSFWWNVRTLARNLHQAITVACWLE